MWNERRERDGTALSGLLMSPKATAISVQQASPSTMVVEFIGIAPTTTSEPASVVVRARKEGNAPVQLSALLSSTGTNRLGNGHGCRRTHQSSPLHTRQRKKVEA
jgi:hypothetical protein